MNSDVHPVVAALVLLASAAAIALWAWASGIAASFGGPAELSEDRYGHVYVQIQHYLIEHDAEGNYFETHDLRDIGVDVLLGDNAFFSNNDILLRRGPDPRTFLDNFRAYKRETNQNSIVPENAESGLFRCDLSTNSCERFGEEGIDFKAAYSIYIDRRMDDVYISDTTRHLIRKYSSDGRELTPPVGGFRFPNELVQHADQLIVADTNHHAIQLVESGTNGYGTKVRTVNVVPDSARYVDHRWPSHFARVGDHWWVNNMQTGMNNGGVYIFRSDWEFDRRLDLPPGADPIAILPVGDAVWISDWNNDVVHRFSSTGEPLGKLESAGLETVLESSRNARLTYTVVSYTGLIVVALIFLVLIFRASGKRQ